MKLQLLSDLHLESHPRFHAEPVPGADLLVLAGDVGSYQEGSRLEEPDFGLGRFSPKKGWPTPVIYVPGNHEYDNLDFDDTHVRLRALCEELGILWLERETLVIEGIRFIGTTLWADFDALVTPTDGLAEALKKRGKAMRAADFYLEKMSSRRNGTPFLSAEFESKGSPARPGCARRWPSPSTAPRSPSPISRPRWPAPIRATGSRPARRASATRSTSCCRKPASGCTATCTAPSTT